LTGSRECPDHQSGRGRSSARRSANLRCAARQGTLRVTWIDSNGNIFDRTLNPYGSAVIPRGLVHTLKNGGKNYSINLSAHSRKQPADHPCLRSQPAYSESREAQAKRWLSSQTGPQHDSVSARRCSTQTRLCFEQHMHDGTWPQSAPARPAASPDVASPVPDSRSSLLAGSLSAVTDTAEQVRRGAPAADAGIVTMMQNICCVWSLHACAVRHGFFASP